MSIISVKNIHKDFANNSVLRDASFEVKEGEFLCMVGPSGCGKSTLLRIMLSLEKPTSGEIITDKSAKPALVFQNFALFPWLSVRDNIGFGLKMKGMPKAEIDKKILPIIDELKLFGSENFHPKELSGGMKQRVGIGRALAIEPSILFLDEPFSAVDALTAKELRKDLLEIWAKRKITAVMVTHLVEEAVELADRVVVFGNDKNKPSIIEIAEIDLPRPRDTRSKEFFAEVDKLEDRIK